MNFFFVQNLYLFFSN
jgi:hypothetical protein